jgi:antagonist of KipI
LQKEDEVAFRLQVDLCALLGKKEFDVLPWKADDDWDHNTGDRVLVLPGHEWDRLNDRSKDIFFDRPFLITNHSDRMGYYLKGEALSTTANEEVLSSAVNFGTVQLLPDGQLVVLMADHQTTGGYPRLAHVISAHESRLAQMKPGDEFSFRFTNQQTAEELYIRQQQHLVQLEHACKFKLEELLSK